MRFDLSIAACLAIVLGVAAFLNWNERPVPWIETKFDYARDLPASWLEPPISGAGTAATEEEQIRVIPVIYGFLGRYPEEVIEDNLRAIYLSHDLFFYGQSYGGTNSLDAIYMTSRGEDEGYTQDYLEGLLHHEFSSILMRNYGFPETEWRAINPPDFVYSENDIWVVEDDGLYDQPPVLLRDGFITQYATTTFENDVNVLAEWLFVQPDRLEGLSASYPAIAEKVALLRAFYLGVDPDIDVQ